MSSRNLRRVLELMQQRYPMPSCASSPEPVLLSESFAPDVNPYQELAAAMDYDDREPDPPPDPEFEFDPDDDPVDSDSDADFDPDSETNPDTGRRSGDTMEPDASGQSPPGPSDKSQPGSDGESKSESSPESQPGPSGEPQPGPSAEPQPEPKDELEHGPNDELKLEPNGVQKAAISGVSKAEFTDEPQLGSSDAPKSVRNGVPKPRPVDEPQPGPSGVQIRKSKSGPKTDLDDDSQPGPSGVKTRKSKGGPKTDFDDDSKPGPSGVKTRKSKGVPKTDFDDDSQPGPSGVKTRKSKGGPKTDLDDDSQPGPSGLKTRKSKGGRKTDLDDDSQPKPSGVKNRKSKGGPKADLDDDSQPVPSGVKTRKSKGGPKIDSSDDTQPGPIAVQKRKSKGGSKTDSSDDMKPESNGVHKRKSKGGSKTDSSDDMKSESSGVHKRKSKGGSKTDSSDDTQSGSIGVQKRKSKGGLKTDTNDEPQSKSGTGAETASKSDDLKPSRKSRRRANRRQRLEEHDIDLIEIVLNEEDPAVVSDSDERSEDLTGRELSQSTLSIFSTDIGSPLPLDDEPVTHVSGFEDSDASIVELSQENSTAEFAYPSPDPYMNGLLEVEDTDESMTIPSLATNQRDSFYSPSPSPSLESSARSYDDAFEVWQVDEEMAESLLAIKSHIMRVSPEERRLFGTDVNISKRRKKTPRERLLRKSIIIEFPEDLLRPYNNSLIMTSHEGPSKTIIFTFDHTLEHQRLHREFLDMLSLGGSKLMLNLDAAARNAHVESMIEIFDSMCRDENYTAANHLIQVIVAVLQYASMPSFDLSDRKSRLPYKFIENRPYHIAMLKYMYLLSNKACHRTALEMCKMMFNLDPSDPLALMFVIDTFALRAREFRWLVDVLEFWSYDREANLMFNLLFSHSLAFFHLVKKSDDATDRRFAGELLQNAIIRFPYVITAIISNISSIEFRPLKESQLYGTYAAASTSASMKKLMDIYGRMTWARWNEPGVVNWFLHNTRVMAQMYIAEKEVQDSVHYYTSYRARMFTGLPEEVLRHMCCIKPLSNWVLDGIEVPVVSSYDAFDPLPPPDEVDRYGYKVRPPSPVPAPTHWADWLEEGEVLNINFDDFDDSSYDYTYTQILETRHRHKGRGKGNRGPYPSGALFDEGLQGNSKRRRQLLKDAPRARHFRHQFR